jgi:hypothetical protein
MHVDVYVGRGTVIYTLIYLFKLDTIVGPNSFGSMITYN